MDPDGQQEQVCWVVEYFSIPNCGGVKLCVLEGSVEMECNESAYVPNGG